METKQRRSLLDYAESKMIKETNDPIKLRLDTMSQIKYVDVMLVI